MGIHETIRILLIGRISGKNSNGDFSSGRRKKGNHFENYLRISNDIKWVLIEIFSQLWENLFKTFAVGRTVETLLHAFGWAWLLKLFRWTLASCQAFLGNLIKFCIFFFKNVFCDKLRDYIDLPMFLLSLEENIFILNSLGKFLKPKCQ